MRDPALERPIESPRSYRLGKLRRTWRQVLYVLVVPVWMLAVKRWSWQVGLSSACLVIGLGLMLLVDGVPTWRSSMVEIRAARTARKICSRAIDALRHGDGEEAERLLRVAWATPNLGPPALAGVTFNLGLALMLRGEAATGQSLILHAHASGWMATRRYGWSEQPNARRDRAMLDVAYILHHARIGAPQEALRLHLTVDLSALPPPYGTVTLAALAFAAHRLGDAALSAALLDRAESVPIDHWAWTRLGWPELRALVADHRPAGAPYVPPPAR